MNSNKNIITVIAVVALIVVFVLIVMRRNTSPLAPDGNATSTETTDASTSSVDVKVDSKGGFLDGANVQVEATPVKDGETIVFDGKSFLPSILNVKMGETVTFSNASKQDFWPATDLHPTHQDYPGSDTKKCGTAEAAKMFDACKKIKPGASWNFKFNEIGAWTYHDHLKAAIQGTIVVQ